MAAIDIVVLCSAIGADDSSLIYKPPNLSTTFSPQPSLFKQNHYHFSHKPDLLNTVSILYPTQPTHHLPTTTTPQSTAVTSPM